ncbi:hypothetical protein LCGC14_1335950 [marine sediment metagenome]|uniref:Uncharacterized protein n=1 Tax=marine sediment metagenome TaxID=412755 RepID=A0A0F9KF38_9ZZZZ
MAISIAKASILKDTWETFYDRVNTQVTSVTTDTSDVFTIQTYTSSFPDKKIDDKDSYPIIIVNPTNIDWDPFTFTKKWVNGTVEIEIYCTNSEACDMFLDAIVNTIETYRSDLWENKVYFVDLESTDSESVPRGGFKIHIRRCIFSFRLAITKTRP